MKGSNSLMEWLVKLIFFLMLLPFFVNLALSVLSSTLRMILVFLAAILPWLIGLFVVAGAVAGLAAAGIVRRRFRPQDHDYNLPAGIPRIRRPRGSCRGDDDKWKRAIPGPTHPYI